MVMGMMSIGKEHAMSIGHDIESETDNQISYEYCLEPVQCLSDHN